VPVPEPEGEAVICNDHQQFAWVEREQFAYYLTVAYMTADPNDWPSFRRAIHGALVAALALNRHLAQDTRPDEAPRQQQAMRLLDDARNRYNPAVTWAGFVLELWARRREFRLAMEH
jgi:hypothetical protein